MTSCEAIPESLGLIGLVLAGGKAYVLAVGFHF